jgi:PAS domain S-box-containing protein
MVHATGVERQLAPEDIIVSKTDPKGHLTYVNDTFIDISGYADTELIGKPHNVIRHPDMPRVIFRLLWDTIKDRQEIFAYVVNMAADGSHYWVLAHVTPSFGERGNVIGYHSNRRAPSRAALREIVPLYAQLLREETKHQNVREATDASSALLEQILADRRQTYDEFVWELISQGGAAA